MKKNTAGQIIGAQMINASTGAAFTGSVSVYVTVDGGTQAIGSVGSGACAHEGNGFHTYAPAQAETNGDHVAFTFIGTGAVPATVQVYPSFPQTGDAFARIGAPVGASISADIAGVQSDTNDIQTRLPASLVSGRMDASVGAIASGVDFSTTMKASINTEADTALSDVGLTSTVTGRIDAAISSRLATAGYTAPLDAAGVRSAVGLASANLDTQLDALPTNAELSTALGAADDAILAVLGTPAGASLAADVAAVKAQTAAIETDTQDIQTRLPASLVSGRIDASVGAMAANVMTAAAAAADLTTELQSGLATASALAAVASDVADVLVDTGTTLPATLSTIAGYIDTEVAAIKAKTDLIPAAPAAVGDIPTALQNADALLNRDMSAVSDTNARSPLNALRFIRNKWTISGTTLSVKKEDDSTEAWTATVSTTPGADPVTGNDPA